MSLHVLTRDKLAVAVGDPMKAARVSDRTAPCSSAEPEMILWQTENRFVTLGELQNREVACKSGIAVLRVCEQAKSGIAPSSVVNALRGIQKQSQREFRSLEQFGAQIGRDYDAVLADVLAMWAKGYLQLHPTRNCRLELADKEREVRKKEEAKSRTPG